MQSPHGKDDLTAVKLLLRAGVLSFFNWVGK